MWQVTFRDKFSGHETNHHFKNQEAAIRWIDNWKIELGNDEDFSVSEPIELPGPAPERALGGRLVNEKNMRRTNLDNFLDHLLKEDNPPPPPENTQDFAPVEVPKDVSLDQVIDRYLIRYEKESIPTVDDYEHELYGEDTVEHYSKVLDEALLEQEPDDELDLEGDPEEEEDLGGDEPPPPPDDDAGLELGGGEEDPEAGPGAVGDTADAGEPAVVATPQINLQDFSRSVARMVNNYEALLKPKETILNRIEAYIASNYDERTAQELMDILDTNYSLRTSETEAANQEEFPEPFAVGALSTDA